MTMRRRILLLPILLPLIAVAADRGELRPPAPTTNDSARQIAEARKIEKKFLALKALRDKGWITEEDYQRKKRQYLQQL